MKKLILLISLSTQLSTVFSQTYTSTAGGGIPDGGPMVQFPMTVSGLSPSAIDTVFGLETICFNITHTWDADLNISLQAPDGTIVDLSIANGGSGDDFTNTCLNAYALNSIVTGNAPFTGTFRPQGFIGAINNGQNGNGTWKLLIEDTYGADAGNLIDWSITFGNNPAKPFNFTSSNLPIIVVTTGGLAIPNEPKLEVQMGIIYNGPGIRNYLTDPYNNFANKVGIETRGSSSAGFPQKNYGFETRDINGTQKDTILLGMPLEHDWILYAPYDDKTCLRNVLSYDIANKTGHYASRTQFCELVINGQYQGIYVLMEKIKRDNNRVNISKMLTTDISGDQLTGGYIIKVDRVDGPGSYWTSPYPAADGSSVDYVHVYPQDGTIVPQQRAYIQAYVDSLEDALASPTFTDPINGYRKYLGVNSFIDYFILNEVSKNVDGYRLSTYFYKDKQSSGGKLKAGPAWDYNLAWWNADYCMGDQSNGWAYDIGSVCPGGWQPNFWWAKLLQDPSYTAQLRCRWDELRLSTLSIPTLNNYVDSLAVYLNESQSRHFTAWPILGQYTWPNPSPIPMDYPGEIAAIKAWFYNRITWLDANLPGTCNVGISENSMHENNVSVYPNPFNNAFQLQFYLPHAEKLKIEIRDVLGKIVKSISEQEFPEGENKIEIKLNDDLGKGIYLLSITSSKGVVVKKLSKIE
ncbi:MAG TPA: CotH kinase family protein [Bacteroidia bacterium]|jgi:hypothetical protein